MKESDDDMPEFEPEPEFEYHNVVSPQNEAISELPIQDKDAPSMSTNVPGSLFLLY